MKAVVRFDARLIVRANHDVMRKVVKFHPLMFPKSEYSVRASKEILMIALENAKTLEDGQPKTTIFQCAFEQLKDDEEVLLRAIEAYKTPDFLEYASARMRASRRVMTEAARKYRDALKYAPQSLRADPDLVFLAAQNGLEAIKYASQEIKQE